MKHERLDDFRRLYGDERHPSYSDAQQAYYQNGPAPDWGQRCVSAYASMHPWEDFAETFQAYLDMATILLTTKHFGVVREDIQQFDDMLTAYAQVGILANELNRDMGLLDLVPQVFTPPVVEKMRFIHDLRTETAGQQTEGPASRPGSAA